MIIFLIFFNLILCMVSCKMLSCVTNEDCTKGYICAGSECLKCLSCDMLFREGSSCIVNFNDCGRCLEGYEEISITDFSFVIKPCKPVKRNVNFKECTNVISCPPNNYCSEESCVPCFDCAIVKRLPAVDGCAKALSECGSCMDGFSEVSITAGTNSRQCEMAIGHAPQPKIMRSIFPLWVFLFSLTSVLLYALWSSVTKRGSKKKLNDHIKIIASAPPLCEMNTLETVENGNAESVTQLKEEEPPLALYKNECIQGAKVFQMPNALYYPTDSEEVEDMSIGRDQSLENNSNPLHGSCSRANSSLRTNFSAETVAPHLVSLGEDQVDSSVEENDTSVDGHRSVSLGDEVTIADETADAVAVTGSSTASEI